MKLKSEKNLNNLLEYEDLKIFQDPQGFKFSLDSVLLANFVTINLRTKKILDIGTGNAPIPLILSSKTKAHIVGIEIQTESYMLAKESVKVNGLEHQIEIRNEDIMDYYNQSSSDIYDLIVCNPPYFDTKNDKYINKNKNKSIARHTISLNISKLCLISRKLLKNGGLLAIVHRPENLLDILEEMRKNNIEPKRIQFVYPYSNKKANILLIEGAKNGNKGLKILDSVYIYDENRNYTQDIKNQFK